MGKHDRLETRLRRARAVKTGRAQVEDMRFRAKADASSFKNPLNGYLRAMRVSPEHFFAAVGVWNPALVNRFMRGYALPSYPVLIAVEKATDGAVPPESWLATPAGRHEVERLERQKKRKLREGKVAPGSKHVPTKDNPHFPLWRREIYAKNSKNRAARKQADRDWDAGIITRDEWRAITIHRNVTRKPVDEELGKLLLRDAIRLFPPGWEHLEETAAEREKRWADADAYRERCSEVPQWPFAPAKECAWAMYALRVRGHPKTVGVVAKQHARFDVIARARAAVRAREGRLPLVSDPPQRVAQGVPGLDGGASPKDGA